MVHMGRFDEKIVVSFIYYDGNKKWTVVKRFQY